MKVFFVIISSLLFFQGFSQKPDIQYVSLPDTFLINEIRKLIKEEEKSDSLFSKGLGYLELSFSLTRKDGNSFKRKLIAKDGSGQFTLDRIDTIMTYYLGVLYMSPDGDDNTLGDIYPNYYTFIDNRLVAINNGDKGLTSQYFGFSEDSKMIYDRLIEKYLEKPGSASRRSININRQTRIYYTKSILSDEIRPIVIKKTNVKLRSIH